MRILNQRLTSPQVSKWRLWSKSHYKSLTRRDCQLHIGITQRPLIAKCVQANSDMEFVFALNHESFGCKLGLIPKTRGSYCFPAFWICFLIKPRRQFGKGSSNTSQDWKDIMSTWKDFDGVRTLDWCIVGKWDGNLEMVYAKILIKVYSQCVVLVIEKMKIFSNEFCL